MEHTPPALSWVHALLQHPELGVTAVANQKIARLSPDFKWLPVSEDSNLGRGPIALAGNGDILGVRHVEGREVSVQLWDPREGRTRDISPGFTDVDTMVALVDGRILATGSTENNPSWSATWDPDEKKWTPTSAYLERRATSALALRDGRVLLLCHAQTELFDPKTNTFTRASALTSTRLDAALLQLPDGRVLAAGGDKERAWEPYAFVGTKRTAEIFDLNKKEWSTAGSMRMSRSGAGAVLLPNGRVLVVGGYNAKHQGTGSSEIFDPETLTWAFGPIMPSIASTGPAIALKGGRILVAGGANAPNKYAIMDPAARSDEPIAACDQIWPRSYAEHITCPKGAEYDGLSQLGRLSSLSLEDVSDGDLDVVKGMRQLKALDLQGGTATDLGPLAELQSLEELTIWYINPTLDPITRLSRLRDLALIKVDVSDLKTIGKLTGLQELKIAAPNGSLTPLNLAPLAALSELRELTLNGAKIADLRPLLKLPIESLELNSSELPDIGALKALTSLQRLQLFDAKFSGSLSDLPLGVEVAK